MSSLGYHHAEIGDAFLKSEIRLRMEIDTFRDYIRKNKIKDVFVSEYSRNIINTKNEEPHFSDSKIFFAFDCNEKMMIFSDTWGFLEIEKYEESVNNKIFYSINRLKKNYNDYPFWQNSTGLIYYLVREKGYRKFEDLESSINFFHGDLVDSKYYEKFCSSDPESGYKNITELMISLKAGFPNTSDYDYAKELRAPDKVTLDSFLKVKELMYKLKLKDYTSALIFAVMLNIRKQRSDEKKERMVSLTELRMKISEYLPERPYEDFKEIRSNDELREIIQNEHKLSLIGSFNQLNDEFYFSKLNIYIDASNVIHNGQRRGGKNQNIATPRLDFLEDCIKSLEELGIKVAGIYTDNSRIELLMSDNPDQIQKYHEIKTRLQNKGIEATETFKDEESDVRLIKKLKDDENCYVISNDYYEKYKLTTSERTRLINFERLDNGRYSFNLKYKDGNIELPKFLSGNKEVLCEYEGVSNLSKLGLWPYPDEYSDMEISIFLLNNSK